MAKVIKGSWPETTPTSSGSGGGNMEARVAKLEASVEHIQTDIADIKIDIRDIRKDLTSGFSSIRREFFLGLIFVALGLASLMAKGFNWI